MFRIVDHQDIYLEEDRHQQAMMALESSVFGCGSDDWSVDSDYAFQDFADDVKHQHPHHQRLQTDGQLVQPSAPAPERSSAPIQGSPGGTGESGNFDGGRKEGLRVLGSNEAAAIVAAPEEEAAAQAEATAQAAVTTQSSAAKVAQAGAEEAGAGDKLTPKQGPSARGDSTQSSPAGSGGEDLRSSWPPNARLFGDSGTSTDNTHILRLEQRMFLKVGRLLSVPFQLEPSFRQAVPQG